MSDLSESRSSVLSDWALVNSQGELEGSDVDSNTSSIEVVGRETEGEEDGSRYGDLDSRESSPECIELEQLIKAADVRTRETEPAEKNDAGEETKEGSDVQRPDMCRQRATIPSSALTEDELCTAISYSPQFALQTMGASSLELLKRASPEGTKGSKLGLDSHGSHESEAAASSESVLSVSGVSSVSSTSRSNRTDSDSESDFVRLEKESSCVSTESEEEDSRSLTRTNPMVTSESSVGSGFNFLHNTRALQQPPSSSQQKTPAQLVPTSQEAQLAHPAEEEAEKDQAQGEEIFAAEEHEVVGAHEDGIVGAHEDGIVGAHEVGNNPDSLPQERMDRQEEGLLHEVEVAGEGGEEVIVDDQEGGVDEEEDDEEPEELQAQPDQEPAPLEVGAAEEAEDGAVLQNEADDVDDDADTESATEDGDQDDRIESEQSDDSHSAPPDNLEQVDLSIVNDIGDLPVGRGAVERHYVHLNNQQLNGRLNRVVLAVLVLALGMGLGHWIGSTREHFSQLEIQLSQMKRLHQMQDEYMQCLARNDELLVDSDIALQNERERYQEAIADLRDNSRELQEQLQDAQDRLEQLLTASARVPRGSQQRPSPGSFARDLQYALTLSKLLATSEDQFQISLATWDSESQQQLRQARETFIEMMEQKYIKLQTHLEKRLQQQVDSEKLLNLELQNARRHLNERLNFLEGENAELRITVGKMRYRAASQAEESVPPPEVKPHLPPPRKALPPPPRPLPPPPFADSDDVEKTLEQQAHKGSGSNRKGTGANQADQLRSRTTSDVEPAHVFSLSPETGEEVETVDSTHLSDSFSVECGFKLKEEEEEAAMKPVPESEEEGWKEGTKEEYGSSREAVNDLVPEKRPEVQENQARNEESSAKHDCTSREMPRPIPVDITLLQRNLSQERHRAEMWRHLYLWEREEKRGMNASACLQYLMRSINMSGLMQLMDSWNMTRTGIKGLTNLTSLVTSIAQLHHHLLQSLPALWQDLSANLQDLHSDLSWQQSSEMHSAVDQIGKEWEEEWKANAEEPPHSRWSDGVQSWLNKTRGTLSNVSRHLQQTWDQVKDVSRQLWPSNDSVFGRVAARVKDGMSKLSHKMHGRAFRWFRRRSKFDKLDVRKGSPEAFLEEENNHEEEKKREGGVKERRGHQTFHKEDNRECPKKDRPDNGKKWNHDGQDHLDKHQHQMYERGNKNMSNQKHENSHYKKKEHFSERDYKKSHGNESRKDDKQLKKHLPEKSHHNVSKDEMSDGHYDNDSDGRYKKRSHHYKKYHGGPLIKEKAKTNHPQRDWRDKEVRDKKYNPEEAGTKKDEKRKNYKETEGREKKNTFRSRPDNEETQFSTKSKHHSSHVEKAAEKAKHKIEQQFHKLFTKIGAMSKQSFLAMEEDDLEEMTEDMNEVCDLYMKFKHLDLPHSGYQWLQCQLNFWRKAEHHHVYYSPEEECLKYLAPWQIGFILELRERVERGECTKVLSIPRMDGDRVMKDIEGYYKYECSEESKYKRSNGDEDEEEDDDDDKDNHKYKKHKSQMFPKGQREGEEKKVKHVGHEPYRTENAEESLNKQVNHSDQDLRAWYFLWVEGRNNLRSEEHRSDWLFERAFERDKTRKLESRADWMFERASERGKMREEDHKADWVFERAANRDSYHDDDDEEDEDEDDAIEEREDEHGRWHEKRAWKQHGHHKKDGRAYHHRKHHWHGDAEHRFRHDGNDYRQKYGRTVF